MCRRTGFFPSILDEISSAAGCSISFILLCVKITQHEISSDHMLSGVETHGLSLALISSGQREPFLKALCLHYGGRR